MRKTFITEKPFVVLTLTAVIIAIVAWLRKEYVLEIQLYDTYYIAAVHLLAGLFVLILVGTSLVYWLTRKRDGMKQLTSIHVLGTAGIALYLMCTVGMPANAPAESGLPISISEYRLLEDLNFRLIMGVLILAVLQVLFVVNMILKLVWKPT